MEEIENGMEELVLDGTKNPFLNSVVLARFFQVCDKSDLRQFRLVSRQWHSLSQSRFFSETTLHIHQSAYDDDEHGEDPDLEDPLEWAELGNVLDAGKVSFTSFRVHDLQLCASPLQFYAEEFDHTNIASLEAIYRNMNHFLWESYGQWIRKLEFHGTIIYSVETFKKAIFEFTPNLQELTLCDLDTRGDGLPNDGRGEDEALLVTQPNLRSLTLYDECPLTWRLLFARFPNIQRLVFEENLDENVFVLLLDTLEELTRNAKFKSLTITELVFKDVVIGVDLLERLVQLPQLKLTKMEICKSLHLRDCDKSIVPAVFRFHGQTLKTFTHTNYNYGFTEGEESYPDFPFHGEPLVSLTVLKMDMFPLKNLYFLEKLPNLKVLHLEQYFGERMLKDTDPVVMESMEKLSRLRDFKFWVKATPDFYLSEEAVQMFVALMPNVEILSAQLNPKSLRVVFGGWWELKVLEAHNVEGIIDDEALTGIVDGSEEILPNITYLKYLRELTIVGEGKGKISGVSVLNGFLELPYLHTLNVCFPSEFASEEVSVLTEKFPRGKISRRYSPEEGGWSDSEDEKDNALKRGNSVSSNSQPDSENEEEILAFSGISSRNILRLTNSI